MNFFDKTNDVVYTKDILEVLKLDSLLYLREVNLLDYLTADVAILEKRSRIFADTSNIEGFYDFLSHIVRQLIYVEDLIKKQSSIEEGERNLYSIKQMELYFDIVDRTVEFYALHREEVTSEEYLALFDRVREMAADKEYAQIKKGVARMMQEISRIKSISIGFNFDPSTLTPYEAGVLSINPYFIESGSLIDRILRMDTSMQQMSMAPLVSAKKLCREDEFDALEQSIYRALNKIFKRQIRQWEPEVNAYLTRQLSFLLEILPDLQFILKIVKIQRELQEAGLTLCKPVFRVKEQKAFRARGLYNATLALHLKHTEKGPIIKNDFSFDEKGMLYLLTGPNSGGKSIFLTSVCGAQLMAQLGMMVPASFLELSPVNGIFIHMPVYNALNENGRLADECLKISEMFAEMSEYSLCIFDETYSSTDLSGALELSEHLLRALVQWKVHAIFGTHLHELISCADEINGESGGIDYLSAGITENGVRTYHIERTKSGGRSYAQNIAERMGVTFEALMKHNNTISANTGTVD